MKKNEEPRSPLKDELIELYNNRETCVLRVKTPKKPVQLHFFNGYITWVTSEKFPIMSEPMSPEQVREMVSREEQKGEEEKQKKNEVLKSIRRSIGEITDSLLHQQPLKIEREQTETPFMPVKSMGVKAPALVNALNKRKTVWELIKNNVANYEMIPVWLDSTEKDIYLKKMSDKQKEILKQIDGERSIAQIMEEFPAGDFLILKTITFCAVNKLIELKSPSKQEAAVQVETPEEDVVDTEDETVITKMEISDELKEDVTVESSASVPEETSTSEMAVQTDSMEDESESSAERTGSVAFEEKSAVEHDIVKTEAVREEPVDEAVLNQEIVEEEAATQEAVEEEGAERETVRQESVEEADDTAEEAAEEMKEAAGLEVDDEEIDGLLLRAEAFMGENRLFEAESIVREVLSKSPNNPKAAEFSATIKKSLTDSAYQRISSLDLIPVVKMDISKLDMDAMELSVNEGVTLMRIDGKTSVRNMKSLLCCSQEEILRILFKLVYKGLIDLKPAVRKVAVRKKDGIDKDRIEYREESFSDKVRRIYKKQTNQSFHEILGVPSNASPLDIKTSYERLRKKFDPKSHKELGHAERGLLRIVSHNIDTAYRMLTSADQKPRNTVRRPQAGTSTYHKSNFQTSVDFKTDANGKRSSARPKTSVVRNNLKNRKANNKNNKNNKAEKYFREAVEKHKSQSFKEARELLEKAIKRDSRCGDYYHYMAMVLNDWGRNAQDAERFARKAITFDKENPDYYLTLASIYEKQNNLQRAEKYYKMALAWDPSHYLANEKLKGIKEKQNSGVFKKFFGKLKK